MLEEIEPDLLDPRDAFEEAAEFPGPEVEEVAVEATRVEPLHQRKVFDDTGAPQEVVETTPGEQPFFVAAAPSEPPMDFGATGRIDPGMLPEPWDSDPRTVEIDPSALPPVVKKPIDPKRQSAVDDLVATVLGKSPAADRSVPPKTAVPTVPHQKPAALQKTPEPVAPAPIAAERPAEKTAAVDSPPQVRVTAKVPPSPSVSHQRKPSEVVFFSDAEPFGDVEPAAQSAELVIDARNIVPASTPVEITAEDNSFALKLTGTGALVESGQVRALDIEVPVPGKWVGNRKVTLQLRLTLSPATEDEDDR